jgi:hypothetical protein
MEITGDMDMAISNMPKKVGNSGEFRGDTLFASYTFIQGGYKEKHIKSMAFLKRDDLILGNGEIQITLGASHFE